MRRIIAMLSLTSISEWKSWPPAWSSHRERVPSKPRYKLADLLAQCDSSAPVSADAKAWDSAEPIGREIL
jgi:hypothetical protein